MKIALVHDYLTQLGGGERVLAALGEMFPEAPIFALIYNEKATNGAFKNRKIHTSFLQKIPGAQKYFRALIWLMPLAIEQFDFSDFDFVISVSHSYGKGIITKPGAKHICYCLTPTRYLWFTPTLMHELWGHSAAITLLKPFLYPLLTYLRTWDFQASQRPDYFIADSENVRQRIKKYYKRESEVIYPPVDVEKFRIFDRNNSGGRIRIAEGRSPEARYSDAYFLMVGRMVPYKRFDIAIDAFAKMPEEKLLIIGDGPERNKSELKSDKLGANNIKFLKRVSGSELVKHYADCKALIFPQEEDFGITAVEAMASGRPVIAYRAGGALETVKEGETGLFFNEQTADSLSEAVQKFNDKKFNPEKIRGRAQDFDREIFINKIHKFIERLT